MKKFVKALGAVALTAALVDGIVCRFTIPEIGRAHV